MDNDRPRKDQIFNIAAEIADPELRAAYLDEACGDDTSLREQIERLLQHDQEDASFLESPPPGVEPTDIRPVTEQPGDTIGPYKLLQQIGEGGMGVVYMAEQTEPIDRRVALKIIKPGMDTQQVIARFEAERQALAMMDHPNIAKVLDAGTTESGRPYFVMELVKGMPITRYCDEQQLTPRERLELFLPICQAVQHAHQKGVIHRDLKPSNILVARYDDKAVPKIIDFGVAKAISQRLTEKTMFTQYGQIVGTIEYMSPEQAQFNQLDVDTRSDIYSLGVLLYELLTGNTPFDKQRLRAAAFDELLRIIREEEPPRPSVRLSTCETLPSIAASRHIEPHKLSTLVRGDLDWIVMKALEKDRNRRYETAISFAIDIQHYLDDEPVTACPPSSLYRFKKFVRRNRAGVGVAAIIGLALLVVVGAVAGSVGWVARDHAARRTIVTEAVRRVLAESDEYLNAASYPEALAAARRAETLLATGDVGAPWLQRVAERIKDLEMVTQLEQIRLETCTFREGEFDYAGTDRKYAQVFREYGIDVEKMKPQAAAEQICLRPVAAELVVALDDWMYVRRSPEDDTSWWGLATVAKLADPDLERCRLRSLWGQAVSDETRKEMTELAAPERLKTLSPPTLFLLAKTLQRGGLLQEKLRVLQSAVQLYPGDFWLHFEAASSNAEFSPPRNDEAILHYTAALAIRPRNVAVLNNLGAALANHGKLDEAIACYRKAIEIDPKYASAHGNLGRALRDQGKLEEAVACYRKAIEVDPKSTVAHNGLGIVFDKQGKLEEAIACYRRAIEIDPQVSYSHHNLGNALTDQGKLEEAVACYRKAIEINPQVYNTWNYLGQTLYRQNEWQDAVSAFREAAKLDPQKSWPWQWLGWTQYRAGHWKDSIESLEHSCRLQKGGKGDGGQWLVMALSHWKLAHEMETAPDDRDRHLEEAQRLYKQSIRKGPHPNHPRIIPELRFFHAEARELLAIPARADEPKQPLHAANNDQ